MLEAPVLPPRSTHRRKFRTQDNTRANLTYEKVLQIKHKILEISETKKIHIMDLPMSSIPSNVLFDITSCYIAMYEKLLEEELLVAGYPKPNKLTH